MLGSKVRETASKLRDPESDTSHEWRLWGQEHLCEFEDSLEDSKFQASQIYIMRTCLKKKGKR